MNELRPSKVEDPEYDQPVQRREQDRFGWGALAEGLARGLTPRSEEPIVIGVYGAWGSGKSSLMNLVGEVLETRGDAQKVVVVRFNPWFFKGEEALIRALFVEMAGVLKKHEVVNAENIVKAMRKYVKVLAPVAALVPASPLAALSATAPVVALAAIGASAAKPCIALGLAVIAVLASAASVVKDLLTTVADALDGGPTTLHSEREELQALLRASNTRIVVLIDDIDRLHADEMYEMMKLVRLVGDLPNLSYLLAFDDEVVAGCLAEVQRRLKPEESGRGYLEKIVQMSVRVPEPSAARLYEEALRLLLGVLTERDPGRAEEYDAALETYWVPVFGYHLKGLRQVYRMVNAARMPVMIAGPSADLFLIVMAESLRVFSPYLYGVMRQNLKILFDDVDLDPLVEDRSVDAGTVSEQSYVLDKHPINVGESRAWKKLLQNMRYILLDKGKSQNVMYQLSAAFNMGLANGRDFQRWKKGGTPSDLLVDQIFENYPDVNEVLRLAANLHTYQFSSTSATSSDVMAALIRRKEVDAILSDDSCERCKREKFIWLLAAATAAQVKTMAYEPRVELPSAAPLVNIRDSVKWLYGRSLHFGETLKDIKQRELDRMIQTKGPDHVERKNPKEFLECLDKLRNEALLNYTPLKRWLKERPSTAFIEQMTHAKTLKHTTNLKTKLTELGPAACRSFIVMYFGHPGATPEQAGGSYDKLAEVIDTAWLADHAEINLDVVPAPGAPTERPEATDALRRFLSEHRRRAPQASST
jgi:hypothetical protein